MASVTMESNTTSAIAYRDGVVVWLYRNLILTWTSNGWVQGFIFNKHWIICYIYFVILNVIKIMTGVRSNLHGKQLSSIWVGIIHLAGVVPLFISTWKLFQDNWQFQYDIIFTNLLYSLMWSNLVETFYIVTTNLSQFNNDNITIPQDIIPFLYILKRNNVKKPFSIDLWYLLITRAIIHGLESLGKRNWFLSIDTFINGLMFVTYNQFDSQSINYPTYISHIFFLPKLLSLSYCLVIQLLYWCNINKKNMWELAKDHWVHYQDKSFQEFIVTLALNHASNGMVLQTQNNKKNVVPPVERYSISGYLINSPTYPIWDEYNKDETESKLSKGVKKNKFKSKSYGTSFTMVNAYMSLITLGSWTSYIIIQFIKINIFRRNSKKNIKTKSHHSHHHHCSSKIKDFNKLITKANYSKFLLKPDDEKRLSYLLPNTDSSKDYVPSVNPNDKIYDTEEWAQEVENEDGNEEDDTTLHDELWQLLLSFKSIPTELKSSNLNNEDLMWQISMWSLLRHQLLGDKRLTRSQYANETENELISEIMMEQRFNLPDHEETKSINNENETIFCDGTEGEDDDISDELICPVCRSHPRNVIVWPCQCLVVCDDCRSRLGHRAIKNCLFCDTPVEGYSKVNFV